MNAPAVTIKICVYRIQTENANTASLLYFYFCAASCGVIKYDDSCKIFTMKHSLCNSAATDSVLVGLLRIVDTEEDLFSDNHDNYQAKYFLRPTM